jgi:hypothetical protein
MTMKKYLVPAVAVVVALAVAVFGYLHVTRVGWLTERSDQLERLVAVSWGDGKYGKAFYGAYVYCEPRPDGQLDVKLAVRIGRGGPDGAYTHNPRTLGTVKNDEEAVARWGAITWSDRGLLVGGPANAAGQLFPRHELENHR